MAEITGGAFYDAVTDATGNPRSMSGALEHVAHAGNLVYAGITTQEVTFPHPVLHRREMNLLASRNALPKDFPRIISSSRTAPSTPTPGSPTTSPFEEVPARFESSYPRTGVLKAVIEVTD